MKKLTSFIFAGIFLFGLIFSFEAKSDSSKVCTLAPPGIESSRLDVQNEIVLQKVILGPKGQEGFIATEYLGSPNLQASIYLKTGKSYCLVGDFDGVTSVEVEKKPKAAVLFNVKTKSVSGSDRFFRGYRYMDEQYRLIDCYVRNEKNVTRRCTESEE